MGRSLLYNGATYDVRHGNTDAILLVSGARTSLQTSLDQTNYNWRGALFYFNVSAVPGTDTVQLVIDGKDPASGTYRAIYSATATAATGLSAHALYPGATSAAGFTAASSQILPRTWRWRIVHSASTSFTYSLGISYIV